MSGIYRNQGVRVAAVVLGSALGVVGVGSISPNLVNAAPVVVAQATSNEERAVEFIGLIFANQYDAALAYLHPLLRSGGEEALAERAQEFEAQVGEFQEQQGVETVDNVVLVSATFEEASDTIVVIFDEEGLITGVDFPIEP
ncbi:MAG: hypothetical protein AAFX78_16035 [Cyanobacteria bacterium J06638_20]